LAPRQYLESLQQQGKWNELAEESEADFTERSFHLWLDLQYLLVMAINNLGDFENVKAAILRELAIFLERLPKLPTFTFSDGTRFADLVTQSWIEETVIPALARSEPKEIVSSPAPASDELKTQ